MCEERVAVSERGAGRGRVRAWLLHPRTGCVREVRVAVSGLQVKIARQKDGQLGHRCCWVRDKQLRGGLQSC